MYEILLAEIKENENYIKDAEKHITKLIEKYNLKKSNFKIYKSVFSYKNRVIKDLEISLHPYMSLTEIENKIESFVKKKTIADINNELFTSLSLN